MRVRGKDGEVISSSRVPYSTTIAPSARFFQVATVMASAVN